MEETPKMKPKVYLDEPLITRKDWNSVTRLCYPDPYPSTRSPLVPQFERAVARLLDVDPVRVVAVNSGTTALILSLQARGSKPSTVHTSALSFPATVRAITAAGLTPHLCDIDPLTWNPVLPRVAHRALSVDLYGNWGEFPAAALHGRSVVDSCESIPAPGLVVPGAYCCLSFNGNKTFTTGAGGIVVCPTYKAAHDVRVLADPSQGGLNLRMAGLNAALGLIQLRRYRQFVNAKLTIYQEYRAALGGLVTFQTRVSTSVLWMVACTFPDPVLIPTLRRYLLTKGVPTRSIFLPAGTPTQYPVAWHVFNTGLCLPSSVRNSRTTIRWVCDIIKKGVERCVNS